MQNRTRNPQFSLQPEKSNPNITSAVGMQETAGRLRAKRHSLFTQTVIWVTGVICMAFLLGSLAQAWSNSQLAQKVEAAQQQLSQLKDEQKHLNQLVNYYKDSTVIEREAPGFAEAMRAEALRHTPMGILSRGVSGIAGRTLIVNFPGNPKAIGELFPVIGPTLGHVVTTLQHEGGPTPGH